MQFSIALLINFIVFVAIVAVSVAITCWLWGYSRYKYSWGSAIVTGIIAAIVWMIFNMLPLGSYTLVIAFVAVFLVILLALRHFWPKFSEWPTAFLGTLVCIVLVIVIWLVTWFIISGLGLLAGYLPPIWVIF